MRCPACGPLQQPRLALPGPPTPDNQAAQVWKCGTCLRVDGSLVGLNSKSTGMMPDWKHGHFSLLFDGAQTPATLFFVDHVKQRYYDLSKERKSSQPSIDAEARTPLRDMGCMHTCVASRGAPQQVGAVPGGHRQHLGRARSCKQPAATVHYLACGAACFQAETCRNGPACCRSSRPSRIMHIKARRAGAGERDDAGALRAHQDEGGRLQVQASTNLAGGTGH